MRERRGWFSLRSEVKIPGMGIILIIVRIGIEAERFRATAVITGALLIAYGNLYIISIPIDRHIEKNESSLNWSKDD